MSLVLNISKASRTSKQLAKLAASTTSETQLADALVQKDITDFSITWVGKFNQYGLKKVWLAEKKGLFSQDALGVCIFRRPTVFISGEGRLIIIRLGGQKKYQELLTEAKELITGDEHVPTIIGKLIAAEFMYFSLKQCTPEEAQKEQLRLKPDGKYVETFQNKVGD